MDETASPNKGGKYRSLAINLALVFFFSCAVILLVAKAVDLYFNYQVQKQIITSEQHLRAEEAAALVRSFIQDKFSVIKTTARVGDFANSDQEKILLIIEKLLGDESSFRQIVVVNSQGEELARTSRFSSQMRYELTRETFNSIFADISQKSNYIGPTTIDEINNEPLVVLAVPIMDVFDDVKGAAIVEVNLKFMWDLVNGMKIGENGQAYVVDKMGNLIAFGDITRVLAKENINNLEEVKRFVNNEDKTDEVIMSLAQGITGDRVVTTHVALGSPDWAVIIELPVREAYQFIIQTIGHSILALVISFILTMMVGVYFSKKITQPIINLRDAVVKISEGQLNTKIEIRSNDEIGQLASAFNQMTVKLSESYSVLDQKVKERTTELEEAKVKLQEQLGEVERMNKLMVNRELKMIELKKEIEQLRGSQPTS